MPKSAALCYTAALMKMRNCAEKYQNLTEEPLHSSFLSYNYFNEVNYFQSPDVHVVNTVSKIMNSTTQNQQFVSSNLANNDTASSNSNSTSFQNGGLNHHTLKNGHFTGLNGYSNGTLNGSHHSSNSVLNNGLTGGNSLSTCNSSIGSPLNLNTSVTAQLRNEMLALEEIYRAVEFNPHVVIYLLEYKPLTAPPEHVLRRGNTEALAYAFEFLKHWKNVPGALNMLQLTWKNGEIDLQKK